MLRVSSFVAVIALLAGTLVLAQQPEQPVFRATNRMVPVYATVVDSSGRLVPGLEQADFSVSDNGKPADVGPMRKACSPGRRLGRIRILVPVYQLITYEAG